MKVTVYIYALNGKCYLIMDTFMNRYKVEITVNEFQMLSQAGVKMLGE